MSRGCLRHVQLEAVPIFEVPPFHGSFFMPQSTLRGRVPPALQSQFFREVLGLPWKREDPAVGLFPLAPPLYFLIILFILGGILRSLYMSGVA